MMSNRARYPHLWRSKYSESLVLETCCLCLVCHRDRYNLTLPRLVGKWVLPIIPVESIAAVPASLVAIHRQLPSPSPDKRKPSPAIHLLPFCSNREPLVEHTVNILTDMTSGFGDLLERLSSNSEFESELVQLLGEDGDKLKSFWASDCLVD
ncbi:hypothetical protein F5X98DRAFT_340338 [Xylaria grammica]|nr:hypothetical protein F5X98DRAFT_340338 [Xylaria grammica]